MSKQLETAKGVRDWYSDKAILRKKIKTNLSSLFEKYGFMPLETPMIELQETLFKKGGDEIHSEVFKLSDRGKRDLALRFDHTVPLARFISTNDVNLPLKRYAIGEVFRDGPAQVEQGRYRIFTQCDVDIVGSKSLFAEFELLSLVKDAFNTLGLKDIELNINNRVILDTALNKLKVKENHKTQIISELDKLDKIGKNDVVNNIANITSDYLTKSKVEELLNVLEPNKSNEATYNKIANYLPQNQGLEDIKKIIDYSNKSNYDFVVFNPSLARGLDYYTGTVFEAYTKDKENLKAAISGGGRYDNMLREFTQSKEKIPAVGLSFGLERLVHILDDSNQKKNVSDLYLISMPGCMQYALDVANTLRLSNINVSVHLDEEKRIKKALKYANKEQIPYVGIIGDNELKTNSLALKNLSTGVQKNVDIQMAYVEIARNKVCN